MDRSAALIRIGSAVEQKDVLNMITTFRKNKLVPLYGRLFNKMTKKFETEQSTSSGIWLGIKYINDTFQWDDGARLDYSNWRLGLPYIFITEDLCARMSKDTGKWIDVPCSNKNLVVCEKYNDLTLANIYSAFRNVYYNLTARINEQDEMIEQLRKEVAEARRYYFYNLYKFDMITFIVVKANRQRRSPKSQVFHLGKYGNAGFKFRYFLLRKLSHIYNYKNFV